MKRKAKFGLSGGLLVAMLGVGLFLGLSNSPAPPLLAQVATTQVTGSCFTPGGSANPFSCTSNITANATGSQVQTTLAVTTGSSGGTYSVTQVVLAGDPNCPMSPSSPSALPAGVQSGQSVILTWMCNNTGTIPAGTTVTVSGTASTNITSATVSTSIINSTGAPTITTPVPAITTTPTGAATATPPAAASPGATGVPAGTVTNTANGAAAGIIPPPPPPPPLPPGFSTPAAATATSTPVATGTPSPVTATSTAVAAGTTSSGPAPICGTVTYGAGWNLAGGPSGTILKGSIGLLYTLQAGDSNYESFPVTAGLSGPAGAWVYFPDKSTVSVPCVSKQTFQLALPADHFIIVGNPGDTVAMLSASGPSTYALTFDAATNAYGAPVQLDGGSASGGMELGIGQAAWVVAANGGTLTITN